MVNLGLKLSVLATLIITMACVHLVSRVIVFHGYGMFAIAALLVVAAIASYREP